MISVNQQVIPPDQYHHYAIRFCQLPDGPVPVLYFQGKRVTQAWRIELSANVPEDEMGRNANTT